MAPPAQRWKPRPAVTLAVGAVFAASLAAAHDHGHGDDRIPPGMTISADPIDTTLWAHIFIQMFAFGIVFPTGMVFGMIKSRWHVPTQVFGAALALVGYVLGHMHGGRSFASANVHALFARVLNLGLVLQLSMGAYLKLHLETGVHGRIRRAVRPAHAIVGKAIPVLAWTQMLFGGITAQGMCDGDDYLGQCLAHFIMGSSFIAYGVVLLVLLVAGQPWLRRTGRSQEFFDSAVISVWGCVNTFTEHRWGSAWVRNDWQHTTMGIFWWAAGLLGVWLSRDRDGRPKRNFIPGFVLIVTGWGMSAHPQELHVSAMIHSVFGHTLMAAGLSRIIEIGFVLRDRATVSEDDGRQISSWQYVPVFLIISSGFLFMAANHEQIAMLDMSSMDGVSYILILFSLASVLFLVVHVLVSLYDAGAGAIGPAKSTTAALAAGHEVAQGVQVRDAEEFELEGLISDAEDDEEGRKGRRLNGRSREWRGGGKDEGDQEDEEEGLSSASTLGRNNDNLTK